MPTYVYRVVSDDGEGETFEVVQPMSEPALTHHPVTGEPVRRVYLPPNLATRYTPGSTESKLSNENVAAHGFTKYEKDKLTGRYHRTAGSSGPSEIDPSGLKGQAGL